MKKKYEFEIPSLLADSVSSRVVISVSGVIQIHCVMCSKNKMTGLSQKPEKKYQSIFSSIIVIISCTNLLPNGKISRVCNLFLYIADCNVLFPFSNIAPCLALCDKYIQSDWYCTCWLNKCSSLDTTEERRLQDCDDERTFYLSIKNKCNRPSYANWCSFVS